MIVLFPGFRGDWFRLLVSWYLGLIHMSVICGVGCLFVQLRWLEFGFALG